MLAFGVLAFVLVLGCSEGNPLAPTGTILTVTANPTQVSIGGTSVLTIIGRRPDGNPLADGTEIRLSTTLGSVESLVQTDDQGRATAVLRADSRTGTATVTVTTGDGTTMATADVIIGSTPEDRPNLILSVNPDNIPVGGTATVTVIARNADNTPVGADQEIFLTSTLGTLNPDRPLTDAGGIATSTLRAGAQSGTATVQAILGTSDPATATLTIFDSAAAISLQPVPASIPSTGGTVDLVASVLNAQGQPLQGAAVTFTASPIGSLNPAGIVISNSNGQASAELTVTEEQITASPGITGIAVTATTTTGDGEQLTASAVVTIQ